MSKQTELPTKPAAQKPEPAIDEKQLDQVTGGACANGQHIKIGTIQVRGGSSSSSSTSTSGGS
jgi:hypothetical protein